MKTTQQMVFLFRMILLPVLLVHLIGCAENQSTEPTDVDSQAVLQVHNDYVDGWLNMDQEKIMSLIEGDARLQPSGLSPVDGKSQIQDFWFPQDGSVTSVNDFKTNIISLEVLDTLAISTHHSILDWEYQMDTLSFGMIQEGYNTTIYKKQSDDTWKIWRSMWADVDFQAKNPE
jgi:ketosteroid isomerase-like protein